MSLQVIVSKHLQTSGKRLSSLKDVAGYLLDGVFLTIQRQGLEPLADTELSLLSVKETAQTAVMAETSDSQLFLNCTSKRIKEQVGNIVGHSPDIISDIVKKVADAIKKVVEKALKPITDILKELGKSLKNGLESVASGIGKTFKTIMKNTAEFITKGFKSLGDGVTFIQSTVNNLLSTVAERISVFTLMLKKAFTDLGKNFEAILRITPNQLFNLQKELQRLFQQDQAAFITNIVEKAKIEPERK